MVDTKGEGGSQAEERDLLGLVGLGALDQVADRYRLAWRAAASAVMEAKNSGVELSLERPWRRIFGWPQRSSDKLQTARER